MRAAGCASHAPGPASGRAGAGRHALRIRAQSPDAGVHSRAPGPDGGVDSGAPGPDGGVDSEAPGPGGRRSRTHRHAEECDRRDSGTRRVSGPEGRRRAPRRLGSKPWHLAPEKIAAPPRGPGGGRTRAGPGARECQGGRASRADVLVPHPYGFMHGRTRRVRRKGGAPARAAHGTCPAPPGKPWDRPERGGLADSVGAPAAAFRRAGRTRRTVSANSVGTSGLADPGGPGRRRGAGLLGVTGETSLRAPSATESPRTPHAASTSGRRSRSVSTRGQTVRSPPA